MTVDETQPKVYVGTVNLKISADCVNDISDSDTVTLEVMKPDDTQVSWDASVEDNQYAVYFTQDGDLDKPGTYIIQPKVTTTNDGVFYGKTAEFYVYDLFD